ncbi:HsdM family class I SAM-dependent methyltransferase [Coleofasciculus sp.]|uniref:HsdM family class I SAM-dependent methyltransferase n=1 Tax=Coleofasciculus sp. TaxID=3100458 RepID=UPI003A300878
METKLNPDWIEQLGLSERQPPEFFRSIEQINSGDQPLPQAHAMRRAWQDLELNGILYINKAPYIYFKEVSRIESGQIRRLHRQLWNQGIAPLLVVISPTEFHIYSGLALPAREDQAIDQDNRLVETLERVADALELRQFIRSAELGELFRKSPKSFNPNLRVDRYLLENLDAARRRLLEGKQSDRLDIRTVNGLLWRTIFTCYLVDRKIVGASYFSQIGIEDAHKIIDFLKKYKADDAKKLLYALFQKLKRDFNGDLFDTDLQAESELIKNQHIKIIKSFLQGDDLSSGQLSLGFWAYDFSIIPVETISGIYERFIEAENANEKRKSGTYYTPRFLAEIVLDTALDGFSSLLDKQFLDPACGSGIFLVALFNRLAEEWHIKHKTASNDECAAVFIDILQQNISGIDVSETACRIAAFSLYLAFLDQLDPRDIQKLQEKGNALPKLVGYNILCRDFFEQNSPIPTEHFDLVVGNPPWAQISGEESLMEKWCAEADLPIAQRQLAYGFVWKAPYHVKKNGRVCFLLPAGILFNHQEKALKFQHKWLTTYNVEQIINLADMRFYLFDQATFATLIVRYNKKKPERNNSIQYITPKTELETLRSEILSISPEDEVSVSLREVLYDLEHNEAALVWKQQFWGTPRDRKLLERLRLLPKLSELVDTVLELTKNKKRQKRWIMGQGFQPLTSKDDPRKIITVSWSKEQLLISGKSKNIDLIILESDCIPVEERFRKLRRFTKWRDIFSAPHILITQGMRTAFADFDVFFQDSIQGIHGEEEDSELLMFLSAFLQSNLAKYYLFHTVSSWGIYSNKAHEIELLRLPFPLPEVTYSPSESKKIIQEVVQIMRSSKEEIEMRFFRRNEIIKQAKQKMSGLVYDYYNIDELEKVLIDDTINYWISSITPNRGTRSIPTLENSQSEERLEYLKLLCNVLNGFTDRSPYKIRGNLLVSSPMGAGLVILERTNNSHQSITDYEQESTSRLDAAIQRIFHFLPNDQGSIRYLRNLKVFDQDKLYIFKPLTRRFWTKTFALNDADQISAALLTAGYRKNS